MQFEELIQEFNNTIGRNMGIVVYAEAKSDIDELLSDIKTSSQKQIGASPLPNIFHCYPDIAKEVLSQTELVSLDTYITKDEKDCFVDAFIEEGSLGTEKTWYLYPIAKSAEVMMLNKTAWDAFSADTGVSIEALSTWESIVKVAEQYYDWTDGHAFLGMDSFANYMEIGAAQLGKDIFFYTNDSLDIQADYDVFKKLWDYYYLPYINGHYLKVGRFRSDDVKIGKIIAAICSTSSAPYFPSEVTTDNHTTYPIDYLVLPIPLFEHATPYYIQQGADMAIIKGTPKEEYASIVFLQWLTQLEQNHRFTLQNGYLPVMKDALEPAAIQAFYQKHETNQIIQDTVYTALEQFESGSIYATGDSIPYSARVLLETSMPTLAMNRRLEILSASDSQSAQALLEKYASSNNFDEWYRTLLSELLSGLETQ